MREAAQISSALPPFFPRPMRERDPLWAFGPVPGNSETVRNSHAQWPCAVRALTSAVSLSKASDAPAK